MHSWCPQKRRVPGVLSTVRPFWGKGWAALCFLLCSQASGTQQGLVEAELLGSTCCRPLDTGEGPSRGAGEELTWAAPDAPAWPLLASVCWSHLKSVSLGLRPMLDLALAPQNP